jgi:hypothetical protein
MLGLPFLFKNGWQDYIIEASFNKAGFEGG